MKIAIGTAIGAGGAKGGVGSPPDPGGGAHPYPNILANLTSWWSMDEASGTRNDSHGANHLTDATTTASAAGKVGNAADFDADALTCADNPSLSTGDVDFTWAAWVYPESVSGFHAIAVKDGGVPEREFRFWQVNNVFSFLVMAGGGANAQADTGGIITANAWYFVVGWHDAVNNTVNIQVNNGTPVTVSYSGGAIDSTTQLTVGDAVGGGWPFAGLIDELAFWKGYILSAAERTWLYNAGAGRSYAEVSAGAEEPAWWLPAGITAAQVLGAYQFKGADSLAASLVNWANPGVYDIGIPPGCTWSAANGWRHTSYASPVYLAPELLLHSATQTIVWYGGNLITNNGGMVSLNGGGSYPAFGMYGPPQASTNPGVLVSGGTVATGGVIALSGTKLYQDGVHVATAASTSNGTGTHVRLGSGEPYPGDWSSGDEYAAVFYDVLLTDAQVAELHANMLAMPPGPAVPPALALDMLRDVLEDAPPLLPILIAPPDLQPPDDDE